MVYNYVSARVLPRGVGVRWRDEDLSREIVSDIFQHFEVVILTLETGLGDTLLVNLNQLRQTYRTYNNTLEVFLQSIGDMTLETMDTLPDGDAGFAIYTDAYLASYRTGYASAGLVLPENYPLSDYPDIEVSRLPEAGGDIRYLHSHCLMSVNGYFHQTEQINDRVYVKDGGITARAWAQPRVGILSFYGIGEVPRVNFRGDQIVAEDERALRDRVLVKLDEPLGEGGWCMVIGGYLTMPEDGVCWMTSDTEIAIDLNRLFYIERLMESRKTIDLSSLNLRKPDDHVDGIILEEAWSDDTIRAYMTLSQTFLVKIGREHVYWNEKPVRPTGTPGTLISVEEPVSPLFVGYGKLGEYWKIQEGDRWSLTLTDAQYRDYLFTRQPQEDFEIVTDTVDHHGWKRFVQAKMLEIGGWGART